MKPIDKIRTLIHDRFGNNQAEFSRAIGRSPAQVNQWLSGYRNPDVKVCRLIERALGLDVDSLMDDSVNIYSIEDSTCELIEELPAVYELTTSDSPEIVEITQIARQMDDIGRGMLLREARAILKERFDTGKREAG